MNQHAPAEAFPDAPDYIDAETGGELPAHVPALPVVLDGPAHTVPFPARSFTTGQVNVTDQSGSVIGHNPARRDLLLLNTGAQTAYIAATQGEATPTSGFPLLAGAALKLDTSHRVFAACATGLSTTLGLLAQHEDGR